MNRKHAIVGVAEFIKDRMQRSYDEPSVALTEAIQFTQRVNEGYEHDDRGFTIEWSDKTNQSGGWYRTENVRLTPTELATAIGLATRWSEQPQNAEPITLEQYRQERKAMRGKQTAMTDGPVALEKDLT